MILCSVIFTGCSIPHKNEGTPFWVSWTGIVQSGSRTIISYTLRDGENIVESKNDYQFILNQTDAPFIGFNDIVSNIQPGQKKILTLPPELLYGWEQTQQILHITQLKKEYIKKEPIQFYESSNKDNPFVWKKLVVWLEGNIGNQTLEIKKVDIDSLMIGYKNPSGLFQESEFRLGAEAPWNGWKMRIEKIDGEYVTVSYPTPHPLAWKSLTLEVEKKSAQ